MELAGEYFNSRPRAGGDFAPKVILYLALHYFNSRPRAGGDRSRQHVASRRTKFQFTPPRGGRHKRIICMVSRMISIHAPARGATPKA